MSKKTLWRMVAGRTTGPYDPAKLRPLVKDGRIGPLDRFSYDGIDWRPADNFPELLRPPPVVERSLLDDAISQPLAPPRNSAKPSELLEPPALRGQQAEEIDDGTLVKAVYVLIALGGGMFFLLVCLMVFSAFRKPVQARPAVPAVADQMPTLPPPPVEQTPPGEGSEGVGAPLEGDEVGGEGSGPQPVKSKMIYEESEV